MFRPDVVVVGAGFAGLSAAVRLAGRGARVLVLEQHRRLGGRATAFPDRGTGEVVDNGQHAFFGCYTETFAFLDVIGATADVALDERLDLEMVDAAGSRSRLRAASLPAPLHLLAGLMRWPALGMRDRIAALRAGRVLRQLAADERARRPLPPRLGAITVAAWLDELRQTPRIRELLWDPLAVAALNQLPEEAAAAPFARVLARMFGGSRRDAAIGLSRRPLDELYAVPARRYLEARGSAVQTGARAKLMTAGGRAKGVVVKGDLIEAGAVIATVPWHELPAFVDGVPEMADVAAAAASMGSSPIVSVNLWLDRPVTDAAFIGLAGRTFQWIFDRSRILAEPSAHLAMVSSGASAIVGLDNRTLVERARDDLASALPAARGAQVRRAIVVREKRATFSLAPGGPARPGAWTPVAGFFLAGDWTDTGLPATIEGAVASGHRAADLVQAG
ncbi:MAG TPA: hydroxysqualene dehydroxylase HpnE [Vicinamibacterales bacterium]